MKYDKVEDNKKKFTQSNPSQAMFNKMGMKLYGSHIQALYKKSGFNKPTGQQLVAGFNKAKVTAEKMAKSAKAFQGPTGQSLIASYSDRTTNTNRLLNTSIATGEFLGAGPGSKLKPKPSTGKVTTHTTKMGEMEIFNARMRQLHKKRGIKVVNKKKYRAYQGY